MYKKAFTIIELIIVITISLILVGGAVLTYGRSNEEERLDADAAEIASVLQTALTKSRTGDAGQFSATCANMTGYEVAIDRSSYSLGFCCAGNCQDRIVQNYTYSPNVTAETGFTNTTAIAIRFHTLSTQPLVGEKGSVEAYHIQSLQGGGFGLDRITIAPTSFIMKHNTLNQCINISVNAFGIITVGNKYSSGC